MRGNPRTAHSVDRHSQALSSRFRIANTPYDFNPSMAISSLTSAHLPFSSQVEIQFDRPLAGRNGRFRLVSGFRAPLAAGVPTRIGFSIRRPSGLCACRLRTPRRGISPHRLSDSLQHRYPLAGHNFQLLAQPAGIVRHQFCPVAGPADLDIEALPRRQVRVVDPSRRPRCRRCVLGTHVPWMPKRGPDGGAADWCAQVRVHARFDNPYHIMQFCQPLE